MLRRFSTALQRTPLYESHVKYGAKFVPYAGFEMPILYGSQSHIESHHWVRSKVGLFDVSHMLQHSVKGPQAAAFLEKVTPIDTKALAPYTSSLLVLLNEKGGVIDDTIITKHADNEFYMVTNAGCRAKDVAFLDKEKAAFDVQHSTFESTLLAVQGPRAQEVLQKYTLEPLDKVHFGEARHCKIGPADVHLARLGYTGEDGFELLIPSGNEAEAASARAFFERLIDENEDVVRPIGLAARDSLRLEAGMCLYGNELSEEISPVQALLAWLIPKLRRENASFNGAERILDELRTKSVRVRRIGIVSTGPAPRTGAKVFAEGKEVGHITLGLLLPTLGKNVAQAFIDKSVKIGAEVEIALRGKRRQGTVAKLPFVPNNFYRG